ncbi:hypothetical protein EBB07_29620 [Paenibacillaceae bacterium]|nr:hypothetical protein EBB07_29620 [Paenibacillaceae bacterium]
MSTPLVSWLNSTHSAEVITPFNFGVIDAGDRGNPYTFNIWNNKGGATDVSRMEDCSITTKDMDGGLGNTAGKEVPVVSGNWFHAQIDSLGETDLTEPSSKIGADFTKPVGTNGTTKHRKSLTAETWAVSTPYTIGKVIKPITPNGWIYECVQAGTSGSTAPVWKTDIQETVSDGAVLWQPIKIDHKPGAKEIMGVQNDGTPGNSAGNFITLTLQCEVPLNANAGRQNFKVRLSYRHT